MTVPPFTEDATVKTPLGVDLGAELMLLAPESAIFVGASPADATGVVEMIAEVAPVASCALTSAGFVVAAVAVCSVVVARLVVM